MTADGRADPAAAGLIGVDWGTSNLRVHRIGPGGVLLQTRQEARGILKVQPGCFEAALRSLAGDWMDALPRAPVLACGMVGSRQGWREVPYVPCPADLAGIAAGLAPVALAGGGRAMLVPGVACRGEDAVPDVIRGEETKILGVAAELGGAAVVCLPGTHAKWAHVAGGVLQGFRTSMSGELYQALLEHSILGRMARLDAPFSQGAFRRGVARSGAGGGLLHQLFSVRTLRLFDELPEDQAASYLSGLLVGADVRAMSEGSGPGPLCLVGEGPSCAAYLDALEALGRSVRVIPGDAAVVAGLARIAAAAAVTA